MESRAGGSGRGAAPQGQAPSATSASSTPPGLSRSLSQNDADSDRPDGTVSDSALCPQGEGGGGGGGGGGGAAAGAGAGGKHRRRPSLGYKISALVGFSRRKSNSTSQLVAGTRRGCRRGVVS